MKKLFFVFAFLGCLGLVNVNAQGTCPYSKKASETTDVSKKKACSKTAKATCSKTAAAKLASMDDSIEQKVCAKSGNVSYYQTSTCAKSGKVSTNEVKYCSDSQKFVNVAPGSKAMGVSGSNKPACSKAAKASCSKSAGAKSVSLDGKKSCAATCAKTAAAAAKLASMDDSIESKTCGKSGNVSYYRKSVCAKSGNVSMAQVKYDATAAKFVNVSPEAAAAKPVAKKKACSKSCKKKCSKGKAAAKATSSDDAKVKLIKMEEN